MAERHPLPRLLVFPLGFLAVAGLAAARLFPEQVLRLANCTFRNLTTLPCPTCGSTHAAVSLAHARVGPAFAGNPLLVSLGFLCALWAVYAALATVRPAWRRSLDLSRGEKKAASLLAALLVLANWIYLIAR